MARSTARRTFSPVQPLPVLNWIPARLNALPIFSHDQSSLRTRLRSSSPWRRSHQRMTSPSFNLRGTFSPMLRHRLCDDRALGPSPRSISHFISRLKSHFISHFISRSIFERKVPVRKRQCYRPRHSLEGDEGHSLRPRRWIGVGLGASGVTWVFCFHEPRRSASRTRAMAAARPELRSAACRRTSA